MLPRSSKSREDDEIITFKSLHFKGLTLINHPWHPWEILKYEKLI